MDIFKEPLSFSTREKKKEREVVVRTARCRYELSLSLSRARAYLIAFEIRSRPRAPSRRVARVCISRFFPPSARAPVVAMQAMLRWMIAAAVALALAGGAAASILEVRRLA